MTIYPIGTIVQLKESDYLLMVVGFLAEDCILYLGVMYPIGYLPVEQWCTFKNRDIDIIYHIGYDHQFHSKYIQTLQVHVEERKEK